MNNNEVITYSNDQKENEKSRKKQEFQEYIAKLKLERKKKIEEEKEKKKQKQFGVKIDFGHESVEMV